MEKILIIAFVVLAIWYSFQDGEIFGFVSRWGDRLPEKIQQPIFGCNVCQTPWYGTAIYWIFWGNSWQEWLLTVIGAMGVNAALNKLTPHEPMATPVTVVVEKPKPVKKKVAAKRKIVKK